MNKRSFSEEQISALLKNPNIIKCSSKSIGYNNKFKVLAVKQSEEKYLTAVQIFEKADFDLDVIGKNTPKGCLRCWKRIYMSKGMKGLKTDGRGKGRKGRPKNKGDTDACKIKRLEAEVAYLKEENRFLAKLRKKSLN
ncbi:MAG: hypothetical protein WCX77_02115 [Candidatus Paceibacterota bacterium]|jgi:hypothetical protein